MLGLRLSVGGLAGRARAVFSDGMGMFDKLRKKAEQAVDEHGDKIAQGLDKAGDLVDKKTGGKYSDKIDTGVDKAKAALDKRQSGDDGTR